MTEMAKSVRDNMGGTRLTPFSPDFPMHTQRKALIASLLENVSDEVDSSSMRIDDFIADENFILLQVQGGMDAVTLGLEGNSQRMRDLVGKGSADADVREAVARGIRAGVRRFKLYMISNLPGEDEGDILRMLRLGKELADIRDSMGQPNVQIQLSWTPLMIEANTPFQWFAPTPPSPMLSDMWDELRDVKVDFKIGTKSEPNKMAFFQACQRASREVGEALVDVMLEVDQACWGGVPKNLRALLAEKLHERGFHNDYGDVFDERGRNDLFGWEFVNQGISTELLWITYVQMREFAEQTDSQSYDGNFDEQYHGNEWISRCDVRCYGKVCGVCDHQDLKIRTGYIRAAQTERDVDVTTIVPIDQRTQAFKIRAQIYKPERYRFVQNDHWRFNFRRAAYRAQAKLGLDYGIAKRSIKFVTDAISHKDWTCGIDYVEFAMTRPMPEQLVWDFLAATNDELCADPADEHTRWLRLREFTTLPATVKSLRSTIDLSLYELELDSDPTPVLQKIAEWHRADYVKMIIKSDSAFYAMSAEEVNGKEYVDDFWLVRDGSHLRLRMLLRGRPSPYVAYAALMGRASWIEAAQYPVRCLDCFVVVDKGQSDFLRPSCVDCGYQIPVNVLDHPWDLDYCPRCRDAHDGTMIVEAQYV